MNDILLDGSPNMAVAKSGYTPPVDAVQQTSIQQNGVDAEYGHSAGGVIGIITKSGSNEIHGSAYYMNRNPDMSALSDRTTFTANLTRQNTFGGTVGGPIRKNKLFTFFAYEHIKLSNPYGSRIETLPTAAERTGVERARRRLGPARRRQAPARHRQAPARHPRERARRRPEARTTPRPPRPARVAPVREG